MQGYLYIRTPTLPPYGNDRTSLDRREFLEMAEGVEKVGAVRLFATIVPLSGACGNIDSTLPPTLNHCFKNSDPGDFFNTLG